ncbi:ExbD/TolR family protein [Haloferula chungangensis]|uniref:ExbD/TolR family protein n=1 Tax=Haloferula chungangensis TaxID=1048331 RepID=A0ABW2L9Q7_9BACT
MASSSKLRAAKADEGEDLAIDMSPMIDMVFLLLIFFLVNATMIIVKMDPEVEPPVAKNSMKAEDGNGRIVINIRQEGELYSEAGEELTDDDVIDLVTKEKDVIVQQGYEPKLHLRGDKRAVFKHCRKVLRLSAKAGVDKVVFATYNFEK